MKQILILIFTLGTFITTQAQNVVLDTVFFEMVDSTLYQITKVQFDDGSYSESRISTTKEEVLRQYSTAIENDGAKYANAGRIYITAKPFLAQAIKIEKMLNESLGLSPLGLLQTNYENLFMATSTSTTWELVDKGVTKQVVFSKHPTTGQLRVKVDSDAFRTVFILGQTMVVRNYPAQGDNLILFMINNRVFKDVENEVTLRNVNLQRR